MLININGITAQLQSLTSKLFTRTNFCSFHRTPMSEITGGTTSTRSSIRSNAFLPLYRGNELSAKKDKCVLLLLCLRCFETLWLRWPSDFLDRISVRVFYKISEVLFSDVYSSSSQTERRYRNKVICKRAWTISHYKRI